MTVAPPRPSTPPEGPAPGGAVADPGALRERFLLDPQLVFLNHGSFGACPREVFDELQRWQREMERNPVEFLSRRCASLLLDSRERLARFVGAQARDLVYVPNATTAVNIVARSVALAPGDEVLATDHEYGACELTWQRVCAQRGARYRRVAIPLPFERETFVERMLAAAGPRTRMIFTSHVTSATALIFPLAELCARARERGIATLVDGAHAPGQIDLDLDALGADFYAGNAHKWMCAPKGAGFLHARPEHHALLDAPVTSWGYAAEADGGDRLDACTGHTTLERRLQWQGTRDIAAWLATPAAIDFLGRHVGPAVRARCHAVAVDALHRLSRRFDLPPPCRDDDFAQMVAIPVPHADGEALRRRLFDESRIEVAVTQHGGRCFVRLSVPAYTRDADVDALLAAPALQRDA